MKSRAIVAVAAVGVVVLASCAAAPRASEQASVAALPESAEPALTPSVAPTTVSTLPVSAAPSQALATGLEVDVLADVVADRLVVREAPGLESAPVRLCLPDAPTCGVIVIGQETGNSIVYLLDGPVAADGYEWYRIVADDGMFPGHVGWVATGDAVDPWLVRREVACPEAPAELRDITLAGISQLTALHCFGGEEITIRGYYVAPPPGESLGGDCVTEPAWLVCGLGYHGLRVVEGPWAGDANHLELHLHPDLGPMPPRPGWIEVTGHFDDPAAAECAGAGLELHCRLGFVVTSARASE